MPDDFEVQEAINVRLGRDRILISDLAVLTQVGGEEVVVPAAEVAIFVEIMSPSTKRVDRLLKPGLAAEAGIPQFWLIDPAGPTVTVFELDGVTYQQTVTATGDQHITLTKPFPVDFQPGKLLAAHR